VLQLLEEMWVYISVLCIHSSTTYFLEKHLFIKLVTYNSKTRW
jgi:hypothetical protein